MIVHEFVFITWSLVHILYLHVFNGLCFTIFHLFYSYQRADPNFVMLTPNKEHLAEGIVWKIGKRPMFQSDVNAGNFDGIPRELRPLEKIL